MSRVVIRQWHSYIGLFIAPSVIFFAATGALQVFSLHEAHGHYRPLGLVEKLSSVHKDQVFELGHHQEAESDEKPVAKVEDAHPSDSNHDNERARLSTVLLKSLFCVVGIGLTLSSALGVWIGLTQTKSPRTAWALLVAGTLLPLVLLIA